MSFEQELRTRITKAPLGSIEKNVLRVVLGECQLKASGRPISDDVGLQIVKQMLKSNQENLRYIKSDNPRLKEFEDENVILESLLPPYWSEAQIVQALSEVDLKSAPSDNQAVGLAMQHLKKLSAVVDGTTVRKIVQEARKS